MCYHERVSEPDRRSEILRRKDTLADLLEEVRPYVGMSPEQRDALIQQTSRMVAQMLLDDPEAAARIRNLRDPLPESSRRIWERLMEERRSGRTGP